jgi:cellulose synthase/poly-beta-1,6-N-acetylglucosamine synthase-like glycosyltransferase
MEELMPVEFSWGWAAFEVGVVSLYVFCLLVILLYSATQYYLSLQFRRAKKQLLNDLDEGAMLPHVTVQVPVYNEGEITARIIHHLAQLDYPQDCLQIQLLDDSTDHSCVIARRAIQAVKSEFGVTIEHIRRTERIGYKAGALADAMPYVRGEFVAIFDVDFLPEKKFIRQALKGFYNDKVGVVQTRWGHLNEDYSILTMLQAFGLNGHFIVEQQARSSAGLFLNFNGTAGMWRKACIVDAGGWSHDTLTEDLDLSYRAQLKGWTIHYLNHVVSPAELPITMSALKTQQHRWMKGGAECFVKLWRPLVNESRFGFRQRWHGLFHLFNSSLFVFVFILALLSIYLSGKQFTVVVLQDVMKLSSMFFIATLLLALHYWNGFEGKKGQLLPDVLRFLGVFIGYLIFSLGLSLHNAVAVLEGYLGIKTSFVRTPKFNVITAEDHGTYHYDRKKLSLLHLMEGGMFLIFLYLVIFPPGGFTSFFFPFHIMLMLGFCLVFFTELIGYGKRITQKNDGD